MSNAKKDRSYLLLQFETKTFDKVGKASIKVFEDITLDQLHEKFAKLMGRSLNIIGISQYDAVPYELQVAAWKDDIKNDITVLGLDAYIATYYGHYNEE